MHNSSINMTDLHMWNCPVAVDILHDSCNSTNLVCLYTVDDILRLALSIHQHLTISNLVND